MTTRPSLQNVPNPSASAKPSATPAQKPVSSASASSIPKPPLSVHPAATVSETVHFQGTHPISIGAGTVIHPRAKFLSFQGPIKVGEGCIVGEKSIIGGPPVNSSSGSLTTTTTTTTTNASTITTTIIENLVLIGPIVTIFAGSHIHSAATLDASASLGRGVKVGKHAKVCTSCSIPDGDVVGDWMVIWGGGGGTTSGIRLQRRKRMNGKESEVDDGSRGGTNTGSVETGRLVVLNRERETLTKLVGVGAGKRK